MTNESEGWNLQVGDLVKMKHGYSAPGTVLEVMERHPRADEPGFHSINSVLKMPHARVFWSDHEIMNLTPIMQIARVECE